MQRVYRSARIWFPKQHTCMDSQLQILQKKVSNDRITVNNSSKNLIQSILWLLARAMKRQHEKRKVIELYDK